MVFLGTSYGTKTTCRSAINAFNIIFSSLGIPSPFTRAQVFQRQAEDSWLLAGNKGPVIDVVLWKRMYKGITVYKGASLAEKTAVVPAQVRKKIEFIIQGRQRLDLDSASIILADLCGMLLGLRRSEFLASAEKNPNRTTLLCFRNLAGLSWDLGDKRNGISPLRQVS